MTRRYDAILFDLLTALIDSWTLWNSVAEGPVLGLAWRRAYLRLTYGTIVYRDYEGLVADAALEVGLPASAARRLVDRWDELTPWPEAQGVLEALAGAGLRLGVATNCSEKLGLRAAARLPVQFDAIITAERAQFYKPHPRPYALALSELGSIPGRTLFVAGSPADIPGASAVGMPVVWHNRAGLPATEQGVQPMATLQALGPLLGEVL